VWLLQVCSGVVLNAQAPSPWQHHPHARALCLQAMSWWTCEVLLVMVWGCGAGLTLCESACPSWPRSWLMFFGLVSGAWPVMRALFTPCPPCAPPPGPAHLTHDGPASALKRSLAPLEMPGSGQGPNPPGSSAGKPPGHLTFSVSRWLHCRCGRRALCHRPLLRTPLCVHVSHERRCFSATRDVESTEWRGGPGGGGRGSE
jgi:hypothetical protein